MKAIPNDSDGLALRRLAARGLDLNVPVRLEFYVHADDEVTATRIYDALARARIGEIEVTFDKGELDGDEQMNEANREFWPSWTIYIYRTMRPHHGDIVALQKLLDEFVRPLGGRSDGWGTRLPQPQ